MEKRKIVFYLTIGMILILHLTACTNRSSELPAPDSTVFGYEGETKIILLAPGAHSQFGSGKNTQFEPEQRANPFENVFSKTAVFPPPAIAETDL